MGVNDDDGENDGTGSSGVALPLSANSCCRSPRGCVDVEVYSSSVVAHISKHLLARNVFGIEGVFSEVQ